MNKREFCKLVIGTAACAITVLSLDLVRFPDGGATADEVNESLFFVV
jgi:hypothetical protein